jgi:hypothetical protein
VWVAKAMKYLTHCSQKSDKANAERVRRQA